jgi:phosphohistidine phosphatase SixA
MSELLSVDNIRSTDHARDLTHPGRETAKRIAQMISEKI